MEIYEESIHFIEDLWKKKDIFVSSLSHRVYSKEEILWSSLDLNDLFQLEYKFSLEGTLG